MDSPRMPRCHLPLMEVEHLDEHGNPESKDPSKPKSQWANQIAAQANADGCVTVWARSQDVTPKPEIEVYEWDGFPEV